MDNYGLVWIGRKTNYIPMSAWTFSRDNWVNVTILGNNQECYCAKFTDSTGTPISGDIDFGVVWVKFTAFS